MWFSKFSGDEKREGRPDRRTPGKWATHIWGGIIAVMILTSLGVGLPWAYNRGQASRPEHMQDLLAADSAFQDQVDDFGNELARLASLVPDTVFRTIVRDRIVLDTIWEVDTLTVTLAAEMLPPDTVIHYDTIFAAPQFEIIRIPPETRRFLEVDMTPTLDKILYFVTGTLVGIPIGGAIKNSATACIYVNDQRTECN